MHLTFDPVVVIQTLGYVGLFTIVFAESGLFFGFFLPGDSLLFTAGLLAATHLLNLPSCWCSCPLPHCLATATGLRVWQMGWPQTFTKVDSFFFNRKHIERSEEFYKKYGARAIILARFVPVVRTFVPIVAGVGSMTYSTFITFNAIGGRAVGHWHYTARLLFGQRLPRHGALLNPILLLIVCISVLPIARELWIERQKQKVLIL